MNKIIKKISLSIIAILMTFSLYAPIVSAYVAGTNFHIGVYLEENANRYLVYLSNYNDATCEYSLAEKLPDGSPDTQSAWFPCNTIKDVDGRGVIAVDVGDESEAAFLWVKDSSGTRLTEHEIDYSAATVLKSSRAEYHENTGSRIIAAPYSTDALNPLLSGNAIKVSDTKETIKYVLVKVENLTYQNLVLEAAATKNADKQNPTLFIENMLAFDSSYTTLLPAFSSSEWLDLPADGIIQEPTEARDGDIYVVWLMAYDNPAEPIYDIRIMYCAHEGEDAPALMVLPRTGISYALDGLLLINVVTLGVVTLKRKKLASLINEK